MTFFSQASLCGANLSGAILHGNGFTGTNLRGAIFLEAYLKRILFIGTDLTGAKMGKTTLAYVDPLM